MIAQQTARVRVRSQKVLLDGVTPIAAYSALRAARPGSAFLFESAPHAGELARYSIIGLGAVGELRASGGEVVVSLPQDERRFSASQLLDAGRLLLRTLEPFELDRALAPFTGAYGMASFELAGYFERLPQLPTSADGVPDLHLVVPSTVVVFDHYTHQVTAMSMSCGDRNDLDDLLNELQNASVSSLPASSPVVDLHPAPAARPFVAMVEDAKAAIIAGEIFQVVLSQAWTSATAVDPFSVYRALRSINPSPYMFHLDFGWGTLVGSSPEMLCKLDGRNARVRPLAGTRPRPDASQDEREIEMQLRRDPKERAEHIMLVDLARNDLGRVCEYGSVQVAELLGVERYSHVMHLVSEVCGRLRDERDAFDLFAAAFPAGTVSGAPKIRAMELIAQFEGRRRGYYGGSVARFGFDGSLDACITLRSALVRDGIAHVAAGAGIVADSVAASEDAECRAKASAVVEALRAGGVATS
jgi:anthranilate synthase component 1